MGSSRDYRRARLLAVDDKRANLLALEAVLGSQYDLTFAESGREAIALVNARDDFDVILMDVQMPIMDGFEAAAAIKALPHGRDIPIVFITAIHTEDPFVKRGYEVGGVDYFSKPFDPDILRQKVAIYASFRLKADLLRDRELRLQEIESLLRVGHDLSSVLEHQHVGVLIADIEGRITQMTDEAARVLNAAGVTPRDAYGELLRWWSRDGQAFKQEGSPLDRALHLGEATHNAAIEVICLDGARKRLLCSAHPLRDGHGDVIGVVQLIRDPSDAQKIGAELEQRVTRLIAQEIAAP